MNVAIGFQLYCQQTELLNILLKKKTYFSSVNQKSYSLSIHCTTSHCQDLSKKNEELGYEKLFIRLCQVVAPSNNKLFCGLQNYLNEITQNLWRNQNFPLKILLLETKTAFPKGVKKLMSKRKKVRSQNYIDITWHDMTWFVHVLFSYVGVILNFYFILFIELFSTHKKED